MVSRKFHRLGGHPILDFCNTRIEHAEKSEDRIKDKKSAEEALLQFFQLKLNLSAAQLARLLDLRKMLRAYFQISVTTHQDPIQIKKLNKVLNQLKLNLTVQEDLSLRLHAPGKTVLLEGLILDAFYRLVLTTDPKKIKKCKNPNCSHLFLDNSKNNSRSWCSMRSCGNIIKARRFYRKSRSTQKAGPKT